jgi:hypothetical protein
MVSIFLTMKTTFFDTHDGKQIALKVRKLRKQNLVFKAEFALYLQKKFFEAKRLSYLKKGGWV